VKPFMVDNMKVNDSIDSRRTARRERPPSPGVAPSPAVNGRWEYGSPPEVAGHAGAGSAFMISARPVAVH